MAIPHINDTINDLHWHYYSKPMTVYNIDNLQIPVPIALDELEYQSGPHSYQFLARISHGLPHVIPAMELIDDIYNIYELSVERFKGDFSAIADHFDIQPEDLKQLIRIAVLFHDCAREGNNKDLWDEESAEACYAYLKLYLDETLAAFIADSIRFKDNKKAFKSKYNSIDFNFDFVRELVNMADTLEVMRTRDVFKPAYLPIAKHVTEQTMLDIITDLVVPHRAKIHSQGRLSKEARIAHGKAYKDKNRPKPGKNYALIAKTYYDYSVTYNLGVLNINEENLDHVLYYALRGINEYYMRQETGIQWTHNGFFSPRYHGPQGKDRAKFYKDCLESEDFPKAEKVKVLYTLFATFDGKTLKETVLRSFNQKNHALVLSQLQEIVKALNPHQDLSQMNADVDKYYFTAEGLGPNSN